MKKFLKSISFVGFVLIVGFLMPACTFDISRGQMGDIDQASLFSSPIKTIVVLPIQNASHTSMILYSGKGNMVERLALSLFSDNKKYQHRKSFANPLFVQETIQRAVTKKIILDGYDSFDPDYVERAYFKISNTGKDVTPFELSLAIPADAFLLITIKQWNSEYYLSEGQIAAAFELILVRANDGQVLWSKQFPRRMFELDEDSNSSDIHNSRRQDEILEHITNRIMKGFPKPKAFNRSTSSQKILNEIGMGR